MLYIYDKWLLFLPALQCFIRLPKSVHLLTGGYLLLHLFPEDVHGECSQAWFERCFSAVEVLHFMDFTQVFPALDDETAQEMCLYVV